MKSINKQSTSRGAEEVLDIPEVLKRTGDPAFLEDLLLIFKQDFEEKFRTLQIALSNNQFDLVSEIAHSLKGSSANLGLTAMERAALTLESNAKTACPDITRASVGRLEKEFQRMCSLLFHAKGGFKLTPPNEDVLLEKPWETDVMDGAQSPMLPVLVIDDAIDIHRLFSILTTKTGNLIEMALTGEEALRMFRTKRYRLVFLDLHLPDGNGAEVLLAMRHIERDMKRSRAPVIILSGSPPNEPNLSEMDVDEVLSKPVDLQKVASLIQAYTPKPEGRPCSETICIDAYIKDLVPEYLAHCKEDVSRMLMAMEQENFAAITKEAFLEEIVKLLDETQEWKGLRDLKTKRGDGSTPPQESHHAYDGTKDNLSTLHRFPVKKLNLPDEALKRISRISFFDIYEELEELGIAEEETADLLSTYSNLEHIIDIPHDFVGIGMLPYAFCKTNQVIPIKADGFQGFIISNPLDMPLIDVLGKTVG